MNAWSTSASAFLACILALLAACGDDSPPRRSIQCEPQAETCNGADDDCDGAVDEDLGETTCGQGACEATGPACADGAPVACQPGAPGTESCNGADDDCDGDTDEGCECTSGAERACYGGPEGTVNVGTCRPGLQRCAGGLWGACEGAVTPRDEACGDGADDDCDGVVDETCECRAGESRSCYGGPAGTAGVGACRAGTQACAGGTWGACGGEVRPAAEACNGADDDCDGTVDDGDPEAGVACHTGLPGACDAGVLSCSGGRPVCVQAKAPTADLCNGTDDDCDPATPDGAAEAWFGDPCDGPDGDLCVEGDLLCLGGKQACDDATDTTVEVCNGADDDCDGQWDEGFHDSDQQCTDAEVLGTVSGDSPGAGLTTSGTRSAWFRVRIRDDGSVYDSGYLAATIRLWNPPGADWALEAYCAACGGATIYPTYWGGYGGWDELHVRRDEARGADDSFEVLVRVGYLWATSCDAWQLEVEGDATVTAATCP